HAPPAAVLTRFARAVERDVGITVSIGLARNRLAAKIAAGRDKPRGFCILGTEAATVVADAPVRLLPGIGPALARRLEAKGFTR
ncbi:Y-family DNA polymerase, partial [Staphylococcus aureus]